MREREREIISERRPGSFGREGNQEITNGWDSSKSWEYRAGIGDGGDFRANLFSIFVGNLNPVVDSATLWGVFKVFGKVRDVYLSSKPDARKSGYAFIRFSSLEEAKSIALKTNGMHIYGWPIVSKIAEYGWNRRRGANSGWRSQASSDKVGKEGFSGGLSSQKNFPDYRSYADTVAINNRGSRREVAKDKEDTLTMNWSSLQIDQEWLKRCAVGVLKKFLDISSVNNRLAGRGFTFYSAYLGDKSILWCFDSESEKEDFMSSRFLWDDCFSTVVNWSKALIPQTRLVWINVKGVPLCYWDSKLFVKLGWMIGEPLLVDKETRLRTRFDRGRVLVLLPNKYLCPSEIKVVLEKDVFVVKMEVDDVCPDLLWLEGLLGIHKEANGCFKEENSNVKVKADWVPYKGVGDASLGIGDRSDRGVAGLIGGLGIIDLVKCDINDRGASAKSIDGGFIERREGCGSAVKAVEGGSRLVGGVTDLCVEKVGECSVMGGESNLDINGSVSKGSSANCKNSIGLVDIGEGNGSGGTAAKSGAAAKSGVKGNSMDGGSLDSCAKKVGECSVKGGVSKSNIKCNDCSGSSVNSKKSIGGVSLLGHDKKKSNSKSIRVFNSEDGKCGGVSVSGDQTVYINFEKDKGMLGSGSSSVGGDLGGPAIDLFVDLGDLEPFFRNGKKGVDIAPSSSCARSRGKKNFFPPKIHRMKTRSGFNGNLFNGLGEELADRLTNGIIEDKG